MACVYRFEPEDVAKKCSVCIGVLAVDNYVSARNHIVYLSCVSICQSPRASTVYQSASRRRWRKPPSRKTMGEYLGRRARIISNFYSFAAFDDGFSPRSMRNSSESAFGDEEP